MLVSYEPLPKTLRIFHNDTPFCDFFGRKLGPGRVVYDCIVLKGSFVLDEGRLEPASESGSVTLADEYWLDAPAARSSLRRPGDFHLAKPGCDVVVVGSAQAPRGKAVPRWNCQVSVQRGRQPLLEHRLVSTGPRRFRASAFGTIRTTDPEPTLSTPIRYELAYGGSFADRTTKDGSEPRYITHKPNPCGVGFVDPDAAHAADGLDAPRWELPGEPVETINQDRGLAGVGPVARMWSSRAQFAGTYDPSWRAQQISARERGLTPDYPADFDPRFFQTAHPRLRSTHPFEGDEVVLLSGFLASAPELVFRLPGLRVQAKLLQGVDLWSVRTLALDTVLIDLDALRVDLVWRLQLAPAERTIAAIAELGEEGES